MSASTPQVFRDITPDKFARLVEKARKAGIEMNGNSGTGSKFGVEIAWQYSPEAQELTLQCLKAPFFMSAGDVDKRMQTLVQQSLA